FFDAGMRNVIFQGAPFFGADDDVFHAVDPHRRHLEIVKLAAQVELQNGETVWYDEPSDRSNFAMLTARSENKVAGTENPSVQFLTKQVFDANGTEQSLSRVKVGAFYTGAATMGEPVAMEDEIADGAFAANIASSTVWAGLGN
ncbi:MAG: hypothetical protein ACPGVO_10170, partial [Spirulinaceae cyanobacterium]